MTYESCEPYPGSVNKHGEVEKFDDGLEVTHWFSEASGSRYHFVTAGDKANMPMVMLHGIPESWYAFISQIRDLSDNYFIIAIDLKGYGQSEKRLEGDYSFSGVAGEISVLINKIGIERFYLVGHDRGSVIGDHLCSKEDFNKRIIKYCRMQQSANHPHAEPRPSHKAMASTKGTELFLADDFPRAFYEGRKGFVEGYKYVFNEIPTHVLDRLDREWRYPGIAQAVPLTFKTTDFDKECEDRINFLFENMTMPVLFLQGLLDPGQPVTDYEGLEDMASNFKLQWIEDAGHFQHLEKPDEVTQAIRDFFEVKD